MIKRWKKFIGKEVKIDNLASKYDAKIAVLKEYVGTDYASVKLNTGTLLMLKRERLSLVKK